MKVDWWLVKNLVGLLMMVGFLFLLYSDFGARALEYYRLSFVGSPPLTPSECMAKNWRPVVYCLPSEVVYNQTFIPGYSEGGWAYVNGKWVNTSGLS